MAVTKNTTLPLGDIQYMSTNLAKRTYHFDVAGALTTGAIPFNYIKFDDRVAIVELTGKRDTKGDTSGTTTVILKTQGGSTIGTISFAQADGDNLEAVGTITTTADVNIIDPGQYVYAEITADETSDGQGLHLNVVALKLYNQ